MTVVAPRAGSLRHIGVEIESYDLFHYGEVWRWRLGLRQNASARNSPALSLLGREEFRCRSAPNRYASTGFIRIFVH